MRHALATLTTMRAIRSAFGVVAVTTSLVLPTIDASDVVRMPRSKAFPIGETFQAFGLPSTRLSPIEASLVHVVAAPIVLTSLAATTRIPITATLTQTDPFRTILALEHTPRGGAVLQVEV